MNANEVLAMYENLAGLTRQMSDAAKAGDWNEFANLNVEAKVEARSAAVGVPALEGAQRLRKIDLLKQLMANDRAIRDVTEPYDSQLTARCKHIDSWRILNEGTCGCLFCCRNKDRRREVRIEAKMKKRPSGALLAAEPGARPRIGWRANPSYLLASPLAGCFRRPSPQ